MSNFEKTMDCKVRDTVLRIMERALFYNNTKAKKAIAGSKPTFFVSFAGHTSQLDVDIHPNGWEPNDEAEDFTIYLSGEAAGTADEIKDKLVSVLKRMEEVYNDWHEREYLNE